MPYAFESDLHNSGDWTRSSKQHRDPAQAAIGAASWLEVNARNKHYPSVRLVFVPDALDDARSALIQHHINLGCCDGSDPAACFALKVAPAERKRREKEPGEYDGIEPSDGQSFL